MIKIDKVNKYFNRRKRNQIHIINNTSLEFGDTGLVAILGQSGSGKTTLLNVIGGLDKVDSGEIYINNKKITRRRASTVDKIRNLNIGYIFQDYKLIDNMSVFDNIAISLRMIGVKNKEEIEKRVNYVLDAVNMYRYRNRPAQMLSGGEKQRVAIARAIVKNPSIVIADEPTGNLDGKNSLEIMNIIKAISKEKLVILVTHEVDLANLYATRIIEIQDGKITKDYENKSKNIHDTKNNKINSSMYSDDEKYEYNLEKIMDNKYKIRYSSIYGIIKSIKVGFNRILNYAVLKKLLLLGFSASAMFIVYSISNIAGIIDIRESDYITIDKNYLQVDATNVNIEDYLKYENLEDVDYIIPGDTKANFRVKMDKLYQLSTYESFELSASLVDIGKINENSIVIGRMPQNEYEIVLDKKVINDMFYSEIAQIRFMGIKTEEELLNQVVTIDGMKEFTIVGFVDNSCASIYVSRTLFINILNNMSQSSLGSGIYMNRNEESSMEIKDYNLYLDDITITGGRLPENDYEVIVNKSNSEEMELNKPIKTEINGNQLTVVGYYESKTNKQNFLVNNNTVKYNVISNNYGFTIYPKDKDKVLNKFKYDYQLNIIDRYETDKQDYINKKYDETKNAVIFAGIILIISLVEIYLMMRSSFLSRIKEIGILRAIGIKKIDVYRMFLGEIISITTVASIPGIALMAYILSQLSKIPIVDRMFIINLETVGLSIAIVYIFNVIVGLLPLYRVIRNTPAKILARHDVE